MVFCFICREDVRKYLKKKYSESTHNTKLVHNNNNNNNKRRHIKINVTFILTLSNLIDYLCHPNVCFNTI